MCHCGKENEERRSIRSNRPSKGWDSNYCLRRKPRDERYVPTVTTYLNNFVSKGGNIINQREPLNKNKYCCVGRLENRRFPKIHFGKDCSVTISSTLKNWVSKMNKSASRESKNFSLVVEKIVSAFDGRIPERLFLERRW